MNGGRFDVDLKKKWTRRDAVILDVRETNDTDQQDPGIDVIPWASAAPLSELPKEREIGPQCKWAAERKRQSSGFLKSVGFPSQEHEGWNPRWIDKVDQASPRLIVVVG